MNHSILEYLSKDSSSCGYCKCKETSVSHGMWAHTLTVHDYQSLIDRGWRRCGMYCYKPVMNEICCPAYTIRCDVTNLALTKSQKKVLRKVNAFLKKSTEPGHKTSAGSSLDTQSSNEEDTSCVEQRKVAHNVPTPLSIEERALTVPLPLTDTASTPKANLAVSVHNVPSATSVKPGSGADESKPKCKKAKLIRLERRKAKLEQKQSNEPPKKASNSEKELEDYLQASSDVAVYNKLEITLVPACSDKETLEESWHLFKKYQMTVHHEKEEECGYSSFNHFLVVSPLQTYKGEDAPSCGYGSFHQLYKLDGKLIAVGVLDILPRCVSSVYFFYDPAYAHLSLGTYGALREVELTRKLAVECPLLNQYYLGFYVHTCSKMRYKGKFQPSYLLCPEKYTWHPISGCLPKFDISKYSRLNEENCSEPPEDMAYLEDILVLADRTILPFNAFKAKKSLTTPDLLLVNEYALLVGKQVARRAILRWH